MQDYQHDFLRYAYDHDALLFGEFTLKSGRISPWFFNAGAFNDSRGLRVLGTAYADAIAENSISFDMMFGPAYKGIPLVAATAMALSYKYHYNVPFAFNRKEAKTHGEGGNIVGAPIEGKILLIDDVITAGTAIRECIPLLNTDNSSLDSICISIDRQEVTKGYPGTYALEDLEREFNLDVISIVNFTNVLEFLIMNELDPKIIDAMYQYREVYGVE